jgi:NADH-quinone oxidoreductase subunit F
MSTVAPAGTEHPTAHPTIKICAGTGCVANGSLRVAAAFRQALVRDRAPAGRVEEVDDLGDGLGCDITGCHGFCAMGTLVAIPEQRIMYCRVKPEDVPEIVETTLGRGQAVERLLFRNPADGRSCRGEQEIPFFQKQVRTVLRNCGNINPEIIEEYERIGGYRALTRALREMQPAEVIDEIKRSGLQGRGGAGFPTGFKWQLVAEASADRKFIVCNGDEGDPGAFMDRSVMEGDPNAVIEGMAIAAYAVGASRGFLYVRAEYPLAVQRLRIALDQAARKGYLGAGVLGTDFSFDITIVKGAGAFVCGEETALLNSIEGRRGTPNPRPPYPAIKGLWGRPTLINNVETYANVPRILREGARAFAGVGTDLSKGTKTFALTGKVNNIGLVEVPMGITLREIIFDIGGGIPGGRAFKAAQTGGPSGGCIPASHLDTPIDYKSLLELGSMMGSGGLVVMDDRTCMVELARFFMEFCVEESCGKCPPCRIGTQVMLEILERICRGDGQPGDIERLESLGEHIRRTSLCGLGQSAPNPTLSTIRHFRHEYEEHIDHKRCPAVVCKEIVSSPCKHTCPIDQDVPCYVGLIARGRFDEAIEIVRRENPLPAICGRVCDAACEMVCRAGEGDGEPISIRALKRFLSDYEREHDLDVVPKPKAKREEKVAIVGSGPAGLTCAHYLALEGYGVTIFESLPEAGGMLRVGIPAHRLPKDVLDHDLGMITRMGVEIRTNTAVGKDIQLSDLRRDYQAVFIATGAHRGLPLGIDGGDSLQALDAVDFLRAVNLGEPVSIGRRVVVIGGGNSAVDAAGAARRLGKEVQILYRRTRQEMPALPEEVVGLEEEDIDIRFLVAPQRAVSASEGTPGLECIRMELGAVDDSGRRRPVPIPGSEFLVECDTVISAIGQKPDVEGIVAGSDIGVSRWGTLEVDPETLCAGLDGVFAGGDVVTGPSAVTPSMGHGKIVARMIHDYLRGRPVERHYTVTKPAMDVPVAELAEGEVPGKRRPHMPMLPMEERTTTFKEVHLGLTVDMAMAEAKRCLRCDRS